MLNKTRGENVSLNFSSADATTAAVVTIYDANGAVRPLASWERLVIRTLKGYAATGAGKVTAFGDDDGGVDVDAGESILVFSESGVYDGGPEGHAIKFGKKLYVIAAASGQVDLTGTGDIEEGKTQGTRPNWREQGNGKSLS